jgi:hypothetical protein
MNDEPRMTKTGSKTPAEGVPKRGLKRWVAPQVISSEFAATADGGKRPADGTNVGTKSSGTGGRS